MPRKEEKERHEPLWQPLRYCPECQAFRHTWAELSSFSPSATILVHMKHKEGLGRAVGWQLHAGGLPFLGRYFLLTGQGLSGCQPPKNAHRLLQEHM